MPLKHKDTKNASRFIGKLLCFSVLVAKLRKSYIYFFFILSLFVGISSCKIKRKEYIERHGLHSDKKPSEMAKEIGALSKKQQKAYRKQLRKTDKAIRKRNKEKLKNIVPKIKTKKVRGTTEKSDTPKTKEIIIK